MAGPPRDFFLQGIHYHRRSIRFDTVNGGSTNGVEFPFQVPGGGFITSITIQKVTAFNAGTTNDLTVGVPGSPAAYVSSAQAAAGTAGVVTLPGPGRVAADTPLVVRYTQTGTAATAGEADIVVHFTPR